MPHSDPLPFNATALQARVEAHPLGVAALVDDIEIGDTFARVGDDGGPWEATQRTGAGRWVLLRGRDEAHTTSARLLDPACWTRARAQ